MAWFAGIQFALCGLSFINMLRNASVLIPYQYGTLSAAILGIVITGALWMLLLRYIEKSAALARIFAPGDRHVAKKYILLLLVLPLPKITKGPFARHVEKLPASTTSADTSVSGRPCASNNCV